MLYNLLLLIGLLCRAQNQADEFQQWKEDFSIHYESETEETLRFSIWKEKVKKYGKAALSPLTDRKESEWRAISEMNEKLLAEYNNVGDFVKYPFVNFPKSFVNRVKKTGIDWRELGAVTPPKNQGPHGFCGTFGRVGQIEGQYHLGGGGANPNPRVHSLTNFSVEQLIDCIGGFNDQWPMIHTLGFEELSDYPWNTTNYPDLKPPPCKLDKSKILPDSTLTNATESPGGDEDQMAAFVFFNGPCQAGINADVFHNVSSDHFLVPSNCTEHKGIDHSINIVGFGADKEHGDYWIIKNSWTPQWQDHGYVYIARGINCGNIADVGCQAGTYGDPKYYFLTDDQKEQTKYFS